MTARTDLSMHGRATIPSYRGMLESLLETGLPSLTHREARKTQGVQDRYLCVRHDVDHNLEIALEMGRIEHELGVRATYFLLPPGDYDKAENYYGVIVGRTIRQHPRMREVALELVSLGHEIGLHNDFVQLGTKLGRPVEDLIAEQIAYFRGAGIDVVGTASHGSRFARAHGFVNYEIFTDCVRANLPARTLALPDGASFQTLSVAMQPLGLEYEAYGLKREVYISDTGSRLQIGKEQFDQLVPTMLADLVGSARKVVALIHPEWWKPAQPGEAAAKAAPTVAAKAAAHAPKGAGAPSSAPATVSLPAMAAAAGAASAAPAAGPGAVQFVRADGKPFRIAIRGDCCSRRAMVMNRALFPKGVELIINEKCPNSCFVDTLQGRGAPADAAEAISDVAAMPASLKHYYVGQFARSVLEARDVDLLVFDTYSDMNFELWRHRAEGWALWVHPKFVRSPESLRRDFESIGRATVEQSLEAMCAVIDRVRSLNPHVPVLVLNQPVEYYPKLKDRTGFYRLGEQLAARRPGVYAASALAQGELVPADVGSCGPGLTQHFDGPTSLKMIDEAWRKGLGEHLRGHRPAPASASVPAAPVPVSNLAATPAAAPKPAPAAVAAPAPPRPAVAAAAAPFAVQAPSDGLPVVAIGYGQGRASCAPGCAAQVDAAFKTYAQYFRHPEVDPGAPLPRFTPMLIPTSSIVDFAAWEAHIKTFGNGARLRQKRKAMNAGYVVKLFPWKLHIPDVHDVNHSKAVRSGGAMRGTYLRTVEEMGGAPDRHHKVVMPACREHWSLTFGAFIQAPGHMQGSVQVDEKLVAYISLRRCGDVALYSQILGHGDHLNQGVLVLLHHEVIRWVSENLGGLAQGLRFVMYGGVQNGGESLLQFKRQSGFTPHHVLAYRGDAPGVPAHAQPAAAAAA